MSGATFVSSGPQGPPGPTGAQGDPGPEGPPGGSSLVPLTGPGATANDGEAYWPPGDILDKDTEYEVHILGVCERDATGASRRLPVTVYFVTDGAGVVTIIGQTSGQALNSTGWIGTASLQPVTSGTLGGISKLHLVGKGPAGAVSCTWRFSGTEVHKVALT